MRERNVQGQGQPAVLRWPRDVSGGPADLARDLWPCPPQGATSWPTGNPGSAAGYDWYQGNLDDVSITFG